MWDAQVLLQMSSHSFSILQTLPCVAALDNVFDNRSSPTQVCGFWFETPLETPSCSGACFDILQQRLDENCPPVLSLQGDNVAHQSHLSYIVRWWEWERILLRLQ